MIEFVGKVFEIIFHHNGIVFGGYIRDMIAKVKPNDIDAVVPYKNSYDILDELTELYQSEPEILDCSSDDRELVIYSFQAEGLDKLEIHFYNPSADSLIGDAMVPDFDVNLLCCCPKYGLVNYSKQNQYTVKTIIRNIRNRRAVMLNGKVNQSRITKIKSKGYKFVQFMVPEIDSIVLEVIFKYDGSVYGDYLINKLRNPDSDKPITINGVCSTQVRKRVLKELKVIYSDLEFDMMVDQDGLICNKLEIIFTESGQPPIDQYSISYSDSTGLISYGNIQESANICDLI